MCISGNNNDCLSPLPLDGGTKGIGMVMLFLTDLVLAICSGIANNKWSPDQDSSIDDYAHTGLSMVAFSPLFFLVILAEQTWTSACAHWVLNVMKLPLVLFTDVLFIILYAFLYQGFKSDCGGSTFANNMLKTDCILFSIVGIPCLLWYTFVELQLLCSCRNEFNACGAYSGGNYSSSNTNNSGYYEVTPQFSSYGTYIGTSRVWHN